MKRITRDQAITLATRMRENGYSDKQIQDALKTRVKIDRRDLIDKINPFNDDTSVLEAASNFMDLVDGTFRTGVNAAISDELDLSKAIEKIKNGEFTTGKELNRSIFNDDGGAIGGIATEILASPTNLIPIAGLLNKGGKIVKQGSKAAKAFDKIGDAIKVADRFQSLPFNASLSAGRKALNKLGVSDKVGSTLIETAFRKQDAALKPKNFKEFLSIKGKKSKNAFSSLVKDDNIIDLAKEKFGKVDADSINETIIEKINANAAKRDQILASVDALGSRINPEDVVKPLREKAAKVADNPAIRNKTGQLDSILEEIRLVKNDLTNGANNLDISKYKKSLDRELADKIVKGDNTSLATDINNLTRKGLKEASEKAISNVDPKLAKEFKKLGDETNTYILGIDAGLRDAVVNSRKAPITQFDTMSLAAGPEFLVAKGSGKLIQAPERLARLGNFISREADFKNLLRPESFGNINSNLSKAAEEFIQLFSDN